MRRRAVEPTIVSITFSPISPSWRALFRSGVFTGPGATALLVTPNRAFSRAIVFVKPITPALADE